MSTAFGVANLALFEVVTQEQLQPARQRWHGRTAQGTALVQELRQEIYGIIAVKPVGGNASRMAVTSAKFEAGQVFLPERAHWLPDLEAELFALPGARHDDQCDSISQALFDGDRNLPMEITDEVLADARRWGSERPRYW
jgi:predicted phage terminase large subunit-like protein